jgi:adenylate cyclase
MLSSRQLAAILFTDIVGYTAMMGEDEQKALNLLKQNRNIHKPLIDQFNGRWIKEMGDGVLASFTTVTDAVQCAGAVHKACKSVNGLQLRIGIHLGEVIFENNDVFGDGVNIASRIQANAPAGSIWVSESVNSNISNKKGVFTNFIKEETLKNVKTPVRIYEVTFEDDVDFNPSSKPSPQKNLVPEKSIAVLPFVNMSNDPEQEYFSDGIAEEILISISYLKDLKVAGRTSSFQFKGDKVGLKEIGEKLGVRSVLEGSVRKQDDNVRITAQLVNVNDGFHIWSERFNRKMENIFAIQDEIAIAITEKLKITFLEKEEELIGKVPTRNEEAYQLYLKGRFYWNKRGASMKKGLEYFEQAVALDPDFALAYSGIADTWALLSFYNVVPPNIGMVKAKEAAKKAISLDGSLVEAHSALAFVTAFYDWDWVEAKIKFNKAFAINPNYVHAHYWYSMYLAWIENDYPAAIKEANKAAELEPLVPVSHCIISGANLYLNKNEEALKAAQLAVALDPNSFLAYWYLGNAYIALEEIDKAIEALTTATDLSARHQWPLADLCRAYALNGMTKEAEAIMNEFIERAKTEFISGLYLFIAAYSVERYDEAFGYLEKAIEQRDGIIFSSRALPTFQNARNDPRFRAFWDKIMPLTAH